MEWNGSASHGPVKGQKSDGITRFAKECKLVQATSELQSSCIGVVVSPLFALRFSISAPHHESGRFSAQIVRHEEPATSHAPVAILQLLLYPHCNTVQYELDPSFVSSASASLLHSLRSIYEYNVSTFSYAILLKACIAMHRTFNSSL